jgi:hypothetical protein
MVDLVVPTESSLEVFSPPQMRGKGHAAYQTAVSFKVDLFPFFCPRDS